MVQSTTPTTYYVNSATGNDTANGTQADPFKTITRALRQVRKGERIQLASGTYNTASGERFPLRIIAGVTVIGNEANKGSEILIEGGGAHNSPSDARHDFNVTFAIEDKLELRGVTITNRNDRGTGVWIESPTAIAPTIANCTFKNCDMEGVFVTDGASPKILDSIFSENQGYGISLTADAKGEIRQNLLQKNGVGIDTQDRVTPLISENTIKLNNRSGIIVSGSCRPTLRNNTIEQNLKDGLVAIAQAQPDLGTSKSPGSNLLRGNCQYDLQTTSTETVSLVGNQIDPARIRGTVQIDNNQIPTPLPCPSDPSSYTLSGRVSDRATKQPIPDLTVQATFSDDSQNLLTRTSKTNASGQFSLAFDRDLFQGTPIRVSFQIYQGEQLLPTDAAINNLQPGDRQIEIEVALPSETFQVEGKVASRVSAGIAGLLVRIVDKTVGDDVQLAETVTDENGMYQVKFTDVSLRQRGKAKPDLQARVFISDQFLAASEVRYNASNRETLNVLLNEKASSALRSEYEILIGNLSNHFKGHLGDLQETDDRQDITYLANKTGWDARAVALSALASQFSARTREADSANSLEPAFFYALFRAGLPANEATLYQTDPKTAEAIWKQAIAQGVIQADLENSLPQAVEAFQKQAAISLLNAPALAGLSSLKEMLIVSLGQNEEQQRKFTELRAKHGNDLPEFWKDVRGEFGEATEKRLKLDGKLAYLTLNNASLIRKLHSAIGPNGLNDPLNLVEAGYYHAEKWQEIIGNDPIPPEIPGKDAAEKRDRYSELQAAQLRLSYPTAVVSQMVKSGETPLLVNALGDPVHTFLAEQQGKFEIGIQPIEQYVIKNDLQVLPEVTKEITRIQRVYQITPSDAAMNALLKAGVDSAYAVVRYDQREFVQTFGEEVDGETNAQLIYAKAQQVHNVALNIAVSYLTASNAPAIGVHSPAQIINPTPTGPDPNVSDVIAYSTLENLFGEMDYCTCEHCRSILSPAAYLVDLLLFIDPPTVPAGSVKPQTVLLERRPDIQHLPLTCENTNTPLPYIDLINETLEYYVTNNLSLANYEGHNTETTVTSEELLANPQFVSDRAYETLAGKPVPAGNPPPLLPPTSLLPFHQPLENLRRYFNKFEAPLPSVMESLRKNDNLERASASEYGWRDILMEKLRLSRAEYKRLTDRALSLQQLYGYPPATSDADVLADLSNAKEFTRRVGISYEELIEILKTRFVNPNSTLIPKLERLGVPFSTLKAFKEDAISDAEFDAALAPHLDSSQYGGDIKAWVKNEANYSNIMGLITLTNPNAPGDVCSFDNLEFRYVNPDNTANKVSAFEFVRLIRFIQLWKKLGWTIEQTDKVITALYPINQIPNDPNNTINLQRLDAGFLILLPRLGVLKRVMESLKLKSKKDLLPLLSCFAPIDTHGAGSLYRQMFLSPVLLNQDTAFADDGYGNFLTDNTQKLTNHTETLRAAFLLTDSELSQIITALSYDANTTLTIENISAVFRRGWLARQLKLSVREFLLLNQFTDIDPFAAPDPVDPTILRLIKLINQLRGASLKPTEALYLIWNQDISGKSAPADGEISGFARTLRANFTAIDSEFALVDDPEGQIARVRMVLVYGNDATDLFFGLLNNSFVTTVSYNHGPVNLLTWVSYGHHQTTLEQAILDVAPGLIAYDDALQQLSFNGTLTAAIRDALKAVGGVTDEFKLAVDSLYAENQKVIKANLEQPITDVAPGLIVYDDLRKQLSFKGLLTTAIRDALKAVAGVTAKFQAAVDNLYGENQKVIKPFFDRYPELMPLYDAYIVSNDPVEKKRSDLLANFLPKLKNRRKYQQALQYISAAVKTDLLFASALLDDTTVMYSAADNTRSALNDLTALETPGLSAKFFFRDTATGAVDQTSNAESNLAYVATSSNKLPPNPNPANAISGIWHGYLEAPENGFYNLRIETDTGATVTLTLGGKAIVLTQNGTNWRNSKPIELRAGTLYNIYLQVEKVKDLLMVRWQTSGRGWEVIPPQYLYSATLTDSLRQVYVRFLKATSLAAVLKLTATETAYLAAHADYQIGGQGWLNSLPITGSPNTAISTALLKSLNALLDFARLKSALAPTDERLLIVLKDPNAVTENQDSQLLTLTHWESDSLDSLLIRFGKVTGGNRDRDALKTLDTFSRVYDAFAWVKKLGVSASALIGATTNEPTANTLRDFQAALRARYAQSDWLAVLKPINDEMRGLQRDALVAYILHQMRSNTASAHIDTPEKLFEYFLMDVKMEPCMQTSRIRHALSSVQLFIERCLMNLEPRVASSSINAQQWEWMKRYRVWEANRKVFLYPENWLEPELRDDQSPFFKETMSELLQSDITEDRAAVALLNYLSKLDEVAKLEPCGIHYVENDSGTDDDIAHVVARTAGANRKYYYRRRKQSRWTPWEQIKLDIEDNPVLPVVWQGRLFLFWLRILQQAPLELPQEPSPENLMEDNEEQKLSQLKLTAIKKNASFEAEETTKVTVQAVLCWSEFYNGKWQATKTSDVNKPTELGSFNPNTFDRSRLSISVYEESGALRIIISGMGYGYFLFFVGMGYGSFILYNTHSLPMREEEVQIDLTEILSSLSLYSYRTLNTNGKSLTVGYYNIYPWESPYITSWGSPDITHSVLENEINHYVISPQHFLSSAWDAPFFYGDGRHAFYVTTAREIVKIPEWNGFDFGDIVYPPTWKFDIPPLVFEPIKIIPDLVGPIIKQPGFGITDPLPIEHYVTEDAYINRGIASTGIVRFADKEIGLTGSQARAFIIR